MWIVFSTMCSMKKVQEGQKVIDSHQCIWLHKDGTKYTKYCINRLRKRWYPRYKDRHSNTYFLRHNHYLIRLSWIFFYTFKFILECTIQQQLRDWYNLCIKNLLAYLFLHFQMKMDGNLFMFCFNEKEKHEPYHKSLLERIKTTTFNCPVTRSFLGRGEEIKGILRKQNFFVLFFLKCRQFQKKLIFVSLMCA